MTSDLYDQSYDESQLNFDFYNVEPSYDDDDFDIDSPPYNVLWDFSGGTNQDRYNAIAKLRHLV